MIHLEHVSKCYSLRRHEGVSLRRMIQRALLRAPRSGFHFALTDVSLEVERGASIAILGVNGCGKTTLLKLMSGVTYPTSGVIETSGRVGGVVELGAGFHDDLTGVENVFLHGTLLGLSRREIRDRLDAILDFAELGSFVHAPVRQYSWGMMLRLAFAITVFTDPDVMLVDEALAVGDGYFQWKCLRKMSELREQGTSLVLVTHVPELAEAMCQEAIWLHEGKVRERGRTHLVAGNYNRFSLAASLEANRMPTYRTDMFSMIPSAMRVGTGEVRLLDVQLQDAGGRGTRVFETHSTLEIVLHVEAPEPKPNVAVCIGVECAGQGVVMINSSVAGGVYDLPAGESTIRATISDLSLYPGSYLLGISLVQADDTSNVYDSQVKIQTFMVSEGQYGQAYSTRSVLLPAQVEWDEVSSSG